MDSERLTDLIARGLGTAARHIGSPYDAYRPSSAELPMAAANRYLQLPAAFSSETASFHRPILYGRAARSGIFDTAYTQVGDYLHGSHGTLFIAAQNELLPSLCVLTNRVLKTFRSITPQAVGPSGYGGVTRATLAPVLVDWPASILEAGAGGSGDLPGGGSIPTWTILLPLAPMRIQLADVLRDDKGKSYVVSSAESTSFGWRLTARQAEP